MTCLLVLLLIPTKYYQKIKISMGVMVCTRLRLRGRYLHNKERESCFSCMGHTYWSSSSFLPNFIKICLSVSKLWSVQGCISNFYLVGDNYIIKKPRVVSLVRDTTTGPPLHPYQILSNNLKQYWSYGLHKISASGPITT